MASEAIAPAGAQDLDNYQPTQKEIRLVIGASSLGTIFEWYDFFIYGTLAAAGIIGATFFATENQVIQTLLAWAGFAIGFGFRPMGAVIFGYLGDKLGRKYTFLVTITLMGLATAAVGFVPSVQSIGIAAPIIIILLRIAQGLALGGEYGGAAIYVAEHAPPEKRGFYTSFIQASVAGGFILSLIIVLGTQFIVGDEIWQAWGWRIPFIFSLALLAISLWMRLKLSESPVFQAIKAKGELAKNPLKESFTYPGNFKRMLAVMIGIAAGLTVIWYTSMFSALSLLISTAHMDAIIAQIVVGVGAASGLLWFIYFGALSDKIGRKKPIVWGYVVTLVILFPLFHFMGASANPDLAKAMENQPIIVQGAECNPLGDPSANSCNTALAYLQKNKLAYSRISEGDFTITIGGTTITDTSEDGLTNALDEAGYDLSTVTPNAKQIAAIIACILVLSALAGATYGTVAALLTELFPPHLRYSSMSIPYHIGTGYFGGFLVLISESIIAVTGDPYSGFWYCWIVVLVSLIVTIFFIPETHRPKAKTA